MGGFNSGGFSPSNIVNADLEVDGGTVSVDADNNKVGIGTTSPKTKLTVEGTITVKEQANADSDSAAYGQLWVKSNTPNDLYYTNDAGNDVRITNGTSLAAAASSSAVAADDITAGDAAVTLSTTSGNVTIDSNAGTAKLDGHTGVNIVSSNSGEVDITSAAAIDINATTGITADGTTVSIDGTDDSNFTVTGSGKDLDLVVAGGGTQEIRLTSAGTGAAAINIDTSAGGIDIDSADMITVDAADEITITTTSADGHISLVSAHTSGVAFHIDANADAASEVQIDAGVLDVDVTAGITIDGTTVSIDGTDDSNITVTGSAKDLDLVVAGGGTQELRLTSAGTGAAAINIDTSAGGIDIDSADMITVDAADEITITTTSADGHISLVSAHTSGVAFHIDANADAASEVQIDAGVLDVDVTAGITIDGTTVSIDGTDDSNITVTGSAKDLDLVVAGGGTQELRLTSAGTGAAAINIDATAGGVDVDAAGAISLDSSAGSIDINVVDGQTVKVGLNGAVETIWAPHGTAGSEAWSTTNTSGTTDGAYGQGAVLLEATAGGMGLKWADDKDLWAEGGRAVITANEDAADCIKLHADAGTSQTITIVNDAGTGASAVGITSTAGGITISGDTDHGVIVGNVSGGPVTIGHTTSETTISDNLTVTGTTTLTGIVDSNLTLGVDDTGVDFRIFSATASEGLLYDASEDELGLLLTTKLKFHDIGGDEEIFASADGHLEINSGTTLDCTAPTIDLNASTALTVDGPAVTVADSADGKPVLTLKTTHTTKTSSSELQFLKDAADTEDGEVLGQITFYGEDEGNNNTQFAGIAAEIAESDDGAEGGKLTFRVATHDGELQSGLTIQDGDAEDEIDVFLGYTTTSLTTVAGSLKTQGDEVTFESANSLDPLVIIKNTTSDANGARLQFVKDKGAAGADNDIIGSILFYGDDDAQDNIEFASIHGQVADASNGAEGGRLILKVASHDGEANVGLTIEDGSNEDEVNVVLANGAGSTTTVRGDLVGNGGLDVAENIGQGMTKHLWHQSIDLRASNATDNTVIAGGGSDFKLPEFARITNVYAVPTVASDQTNCNVAIVLDTNGSISAGSGVTGGGNTVEVIGAGAADSRSYDTQGGASDIDCKNDVKKPWYSTTAAWAAADLYVYVVNAGTSNGGGSPSAGTIEVFIEYYGLD
jgi:hypothetical protein